jgi:hypothetical protein
MSIFAGCTLDEFCERYDVTLKERKEIIRYLAYLRMRATLELIYK